MIDTYTAFGLVLFTLAILAFVAVAVRIGIAALERGHVAPDDSRKLVLTDREHDIFCAQEGMVRIENHEWKPFDKDAA